MKLNKWCVRCAECGGSTSRAYARRNDGRCKPCVTGIERSRPSPRSLDDIAREGGYEDTMGVSPEAFEAYRNGGSYRYGE